LSCCGVAAAVCASSELGELGFLVRGREKREKKAWNTLGTWGTCWEPHENPPRAMRKES
jgi:hypothetical protein